MRSPLVLLCPLPCAESAARERHPARWFQPVPEAGRDSREILSQGPGAGEVIPSWRIAGFDSG